MATAWDGDGRIASDPRRGGLAGDAGSDTVRDHWAQVKGSVSAALDRVSPGMLIATGLAAVLLAFGALGLSLLADGGSRPEDLDLAAPPGGGEEGDSTAGTGDAAVGGVAGDSLSDGLTTRGPGARNRDTGGDDEPAGADGTGENAMAGPVAPSPTAAAGSPTTASPTTDLDTTSPSVPRTTAPATTATTASPPSTPTTTEPPHGPGLIGGLLDVLGLG